MLPSHKHLSDEIKSICHLTVKWKMLYEVSCKVKRIKIRNEAQNELIMESKKSNG